MAEGERGSLDKARQTGAAALRKTKDTLDVAYGKALRKRVEEYADLSSVVLAAHEDRLALLEERVTAAEKRTVGGNQGTFYVAVLALVAALVALVLVMM